MTINFSKVSAALGAIGTLAAVAPLFVSSSPATQAVLQKVTAVSQQAASAIQQAQAAATPDDRRQAVLTGLNGLLSVFSVSASQPLMDAAVEAALLAFEPASPSVAETAMAPTATAVAEPSIAPVGHGTVQPPHALPTLKPRPAPRTVPVSSSPEASSPS